MALPMDASTPIGIANDLDLRHLEILKSRVDKDSLKRLQLLPGRFPHEISFPDNSLVSSLIILILQSKQRRHVSSTQYFCPKSVDVFV